MKKLVYFAFFWWILSCAPLAEEGAFPNNVSRVNSQVTPPPSAVTPPPSQDKTKKEEKEGEGNGEEGGEEENEEEGNGEEGGEEENEEEQPRGEEFDGAETPEGGPAPLTNNL